LSQRNGTDAAYQQEETYDAAYEVGQKLPSNFEALYSLPTNTKNNQRTFERPDFGEFQDSDDYLAPQRKNKSSGYSNDQANYYYRTNNDGRQFYNSQNQRTLFKDSYDESSV
jgi:hypothetical protein